MSRSRRLRSTLPLALVLAAGSVSLGCDRLAALGGAELDRASVPTVEVTRSATFTRRVTADGYLEAVEHRDVAAPDRRNRCREKDRARRWSAPCRQYR